MPSSNAAIEVAFAHNFMSKGPFHLVAYFLRKMVVMSLDFVSYFPICINHQAFIVHKQHTTIDTDSLFIIVVVLLPTITSINYMLIIIVASFNQVHNYSISSMDHLDFIITTINSIIIVASNIINN